MGNLRVGHFVGDVQLLRPGPFAGGGDRLLEPIRTGLFEHEIAVGRHAPRRREIDLFLAFLADEHRAADFLRGAADELFDERHHRLHVAVGFVDFQRGEFGVVRAVEAFVAVVLAELEHLVVAAHQQALEIQLRRDAQVHRLAQRVVEGLEGIGDGAAGHGLQHRRLHLEIAARLQEAADERQDAAARVEDLAHLGIGDQVEVALAVAHFDVAEPVPLFRQRMQRLGQQFPLQHLDRLLAGARGEEFALEADEIAEIHRLESGEGFVAQRVLLDVDLELVRAVLQVGEHALAHLAHGHHAAGDAHGQTFGERGPDLGQRTRPFERPAVGPVPGGLQGLQMGQPLVAEFDFVRAQMHDGPRLVKRAHPTPPFPRNPALFPGADHRAPTTRRLPLQIQFGH